VTFWVAALVLGFGALAAYTFSPKMHARIDEHIQAIRDALAAHQEADAKLATAANAPDPATAEQNLTEAHAHNQEAAKNTATAASTAKTPEQKATAASSADIVTARAAKIADALASLGVGECGLRSYPNVFPHTLGALMAKLHTAGMTVTGDNPWDVDTGTGGVKLRAVWDPKTQALKLIVTSKSWAAPCQLIWSKIDPMLKEVMGT
jgi:F0F1-type ATP synthase membrane subunit b/b'